MELQKIEIYKAKSLGNLGGAHRSIIEGSSIQETFSSHQV